MTKTVGLLESVPSLQLLDQILDKILVEGEHASNVPILASIDTETSKERLCEIGISTFDPCCLLIPSTYPTGSDSLNDRITTYFYAKAGSKDRRSHKPYRLGTTEQLRNDNILHIFQTHLTPMDDEGNTRKVVLVGHGISCDLHFLKRHLGLDISRMPNVIAVIDTSHIGRLVLATPQLPSLKKILTVLGLEFVGLHNAAHDSRYTLRALLILFSKHKQQTTWVDGQALPNQLQLIEDIGRCHKIRAGRTWVTTTRIKPIGGLDIFCDDSNDVDVENTGFAALFS